MVSTHQGFPLSLESYLTYLYTRVCADYLVDEQYSIADIANYVWIQGADILDINLEDFPGVKGWIDRIGARDAVQKGLKVGAMVTREQMAENFRGVSRLFGL